MAIKKYITLIKPYCEYNCLHCCYNTKKNISYKKIKKEMIKLQLNGHVVNLYDLSPNSKTIGLFKLTKQLENGEHQGFNWLNLTPEFPLTKDNIEYLKKTKAALHYSIFGSTKEKNSIITGDINSFNRLLMHVIRIRKLLPNNYLSLFMVLHKKNIDEIPGIIKICEKIHFNGFEVAFLAYINKARNKRFKGLYLNDEDIKRFNSIIKKISKQTNIHISVDRTCGPSNPILEKCNIWAPPIKGAYCGCAINQFTVMLGSNLVFPCAAMAGDKRLAIGRYKDGEIKINKKFDFDLNKVGEPCKSCKLLPSCRGGCRADAIFYELEKTGKYNYSAGQRRCFYNTVKESPQNNDMCQNH